MSPSFGHLTSRILPCLRGLLYRPSVTSTYIQLQRSTVTAAAAASLRGHFSTSIWRFEASTTGLPEHLDEKEAGIYAKLSEQLDPSQLDVRDISGGCGSMYAVEIESPKFRGLSTLKMHRRVQDILAEEIKGWHGIQLRTKATPDK
ncbi:hypothetical protein TWF694_000610 [Orbilia ellipsospora]|uniref:Bola-like protein n=1 Tax=Orbilia ellipsospora TaxID=2528407 RepID=A0AAV9XVR6_9PEZI